ncbi:MAG: glycosyltransferase family 4 protein [Candidatus Binataceae bacterium]|jgi:glycosyltransferase involved in cell wall biosynthesis
MKILYLSSLYYPQAVGGAEKIAQWLAEEMAAKGNTVTVATLCQRADARTESINGVKVRYAPIRNVYQPALKEQPKALRMVWHLLDAFNWLAARDVDRIVDEEQPDLVQTNNVVGFSAAVWSRMRARRIPCVHSIFDYYLLCSKSSMFRDGANCKRMCSPCALLTTFRRKAVAKLSAVVAASQYVFDVHEKFGIFDGVPIRRTIHAGLPTAVGKSGAPAGVASPLRVGFLGKLVENKGIELLLKEFQNLDQGRSWELRIGGTGPRDYVDALKNRYASANVQFLGFVDSARFMTEIDLLVVPSLWNDPFPTVVLEALEQGVAVVGSRRGGIPEQIQDGKNGLTFEPAVRGDLARALNDAISMGLTRSEIRPRIADSVRHLTLPRMCEQYEEVYCAVRAGASDRLTASRAQVESYQMDSKA